MVHCNPTNGMARRMYQRHFSLVALRFVCIGFHHWFFVVCRQEGCWFPSPWWRLGSRGVWPEILQPSNPRALQLTTTREETWRSPREPKFDWLQNWRTILKNIPFAPAEIAGAKCAWIFDMANHTSITKINNAAPLLWIARHEPRLTYTFHSFCVAVSNMFKAWLVGFVVDVPRILHQGHPRSKTWTE